MRASGVSDTAAGAFRAARIGRGWTMPRLSTELARHSCPVHPQGFVMSAAVINFAENGKGGKPRVLTLDEAYVLCEVLEIPVMSLFRGMKTPG